MGIYDREYYRGETRGPGFFSSAPVCRAIIVINVAVYLLGRLGFLSPELRHDWLAASSDSILAHGHVWELLTATFLHHDIWHILFNMMLLWFIGTELELVYGSRDFLALYVAAAVLSTLGWAICDTAAPQPRESRWWAPRARSSPCWSSSR